MPEMPTYRAVGQVPGTKGRTLGAEKRVHVGRRWTALLRRRCWGCELHVKLINTHALLRGAAPVEPGEVGAALAQGPSGEERDSGAVAWSGEKDGAEEIQAIRHRDRPVWGVQFHPESLFSEHGKTLLGNFLAL